MRIVVDFVGAMNQISSITSRIPNVAGGLLKLFNSIGARSAAGHFRQSVGSSLQELASVSAFVEKGPYYEREDLTTVRYQIKSSEIDSPAVVSGSKATALLERYKILFGFPHVSHVVGEFGTPENPTLVPSLENERIVSCVGPYEDDHVPVLINVPMGPRVRCPECGQVFKLTRPSLEISVTPKFGMLEQGDLMASMSKVKDPNELDPIAFDYAALAEESEIGKVKARELINRKAIVDTISVDLSSYEAFETKYYATLKELLDKFGLDDGFLEFKKSCNTFEAKMENGSLSDDDIRDYVKKSLEYSGEFEDDASFASMYEQALKTAETFEGYDLFGVVQSANRSVITSLLDEVSSILSDKSRTAELVGQEIRMIQNDRHARKPSSFTIANMRFLGLDADDENHVAAYNSIRSGSDLSAVKSDIAEKSLFNDAETRFEQIRKIIKA